MWPVNAIGGFSLLPPISGDQIGTALCERHFLAPETCSRKQTSKVRGARRLLTRRIDRIEADEFGGQLHGACRHEAIPSHNAEARAQFVR